MTVPIDEHYVRMAREHAQAYQKAWRAENARLERELAETRSALESLATEVDAINPMSRDYDTALIDAWRRAKKILEAGDLEEPKHSPEADDAASVPEKADGEIRPAYYGGKDNVYEAIKVIEAWGLNFSLGSAAKYISRHGKKAGAAAIEDLEKARTYLAFEIDRIKREQRAEGEYS